MNWDHPDNHEFAKRVLCAMSKRFQHLWKWHTLGNQFFNPPTDFRWPGHQHTRFAPNVTIGAFGPVGRSETTDPDYKIGGQWLFQSNLPFYLSHPVAFIDGLNSTLVDDLTARLNWSPIPTEPDIEATLHAQLYTADPTPYVTGPKEPGFFRVNAVGELLRRRNLIWETEIPANSVTETFIGVGRVQPVPDDSKPYGEFLSRAFVAVPSTPTILRLYAIRCGCCFCGK